MPCSSCWPPSRFFYWEKHGRRNSGSPSRTSAKRGHESGCELVSATMVLRHYGYTVNAGDFAARIPISQLRQTKNGLVGENPFHTFIGDPYSPKGLGCYAPVICDAMNSFFSKGGKKQAVALIGTDFDTLLKTYVAHGTPVILWATSNMGKPGTGPRWTEEKTGRIYQWVGGEHCLVLVGYRGKLCYFNDPSGSSLLASFDRDLVEKRYQALGRQAIVVKDIGGQQIRPS